MNDQNKAELRRLAEATGGITWMASRATSHQGERSSRAIYHYPTPYHCVEIVETPDSDPKNNESIHDEPSWAFIGAAHPAAVLSLLDENEQLRAEVEALRKENTALESFRVAYMEWSDKTEWIQRTSEPKDLGRHRADVIFDRLRGSVAEADLLRAENRRLHRRASGLAKVVAWFQLRHISVTKPKWLLSIVAKEGSANG